MRSIDDNAAAVDKSPGLLPEHLVDPRRRLLPIRPDQYSVQIQTTTACNAHCSFCPHPTTWRTQPRRRMSDRVFDRILSQLRKYSLFKVCPYLQSEPLMDPQIFDRIGEIRRRLRFDVLEVSTNPGALTPTRTARLLASVMGAPHEIRLSFHGVDPSSLRRAMGLEFESAVRNSVRLLKEAEAVGARVTIKGLGWARGPVRTNAPLFDEEGFTSFWRTLCARNGLAFERIEIRYGAFHSRSDNVLRPNGSPARLVRQGLEGFGCSRADRWFHFTHDADLILCCNDYNREVVLGNVMDADLEEIVISEKYRSILGQVSGRTACPPDFICLRCSSPGG